MGTLTQRSLTGIRWTAASQLLAQIAQYGSFVLLARLLAPEAFGTVASATLVVGLVAMLNELGLGAALIQRAEVRPGHLNACFAVNAVAGVVLWAALAALSGPIASFFRNPEVGPILVWLGAGFPLIGLAVVPKSLLERELRFKAIGTVDGLAAIATAAVSIGGALLGHGAWSLVTGSLAGYAVQLAGFWLATRYRPGWGFAAAEFRELFGFGLNVLGVRMLSYFNANIDYVVIGRVLGPLSLGAYSLAYKLVTWPMLKVSHVTLRVAFPAFARVQHDEATFRHQYVRLVSTIALVTFPLLTGLAVLAPEVVPLVFGPRWASAVLPTQVLCLTGAFKAIVCSIGTVFMAKGRPDLELKLNLLGTLLLGAGVLVGVQGGIAGVAWGVAASSIVGAPIQQVVANRLIGLGFWRFVAGLRVPALAAAGLALTLLGWRAFATSSGLQDWLIVGAALPIGAITYVGIAGALGFDWRGLAGQLLGKRAAASAT